MFASHVPTIARDLRPREGIAARAIAQGLTVDQLDALDARRHRNRDRTVALRRTGWLTTGDAALAFMAAEAARKLLAAGLIHAGSA